MVDMQLQCLFLELSWKFLISGQRRFGETNMNEKSSRSHTIFRVVSTVHSVYLDYLLSLYFTSLQLNFIFFLNFNFNLILKLKSQSAGNFQWWHLFSLRIFNFVLNLSLFWTRFRPIVDVCLPLSIFSRASWKMMCEANWQKKFWRNFSQKKTHKQGVV